MKITVYTIPDCPFCKQAKDFLTSKGLPFDEKDVLNNKDFLAEMLTKSQNFAGVPFSVLEEGATTLTLKGFTQSEFEEALSKLTQTLPAAASTDTPSSVSGPSVPVTPAVSPEPAKESSMPLPEQPKSNDQSQPKSPDFGMPALDISSAMPAAPVTSSTSMPAAPVTSSTSMPAMSSAAASDNPQDELNSLLEDLQTKVDTLEPLTTPAAPVSAPSAPSMPPVSAPSQNPFQSQSPIGTQVPTQQGVGQNSPSSSVASAPIMPDFSQKQ